jgi:hypothetical protein
MNKELKNLYSIKGHGLARDPDAALSCDKDHGKVAPDRASLGAFGYGLAVLIPFFIFFRVLHRHYHHGNFLVFVIAFAAVLYLVTRLVELKPLYNSWLFLVIIAVAYLKIKTWPTLLSLVLLALAAFLLFLTIARPESLRPLYTVWMKGAHFIGQTVSVVVLGLIFYLVFAPVGIVLKLLRKDLLDQKIEPQKNSYWQQRPPQPFDPKRYQQQF